MAAPLRPLNPFLAPGLSPAMKHGSTLAVTEQNFDGLVGQGIVLLDFWATWCGPCRSFAPTFEAAAVRHPDIVFGKVNTESEPGLATAFRIRAIPTLVVLRDGVLLASQSGALSASALDDLIRRVRVLDMNEVRREISKATPNHAAQV